MFDLYQRNLYVVSTRGPDENPNNISGGMAPNVLAAAKQGEFDIVTWVALERGLTDNFTQAAIFDLDGQRRSKKEFEVAGLEVRIIAATDREWDGHKLSVSDKFYWPISHDRPDLMVPISQEDSNANYDLNQRLALELKSIIDQREDHNSPIWVHDYNHFLFAKIAKDMGIKNPIILKCHVPIPDPDLIEQLPPDQQQKMTDYVQSVAHFDGVMLQSGENVRRYLDILGLDNPPDIPDLHEYARIITPDGHVQFVGNTTISINVNDILKKREATQLTDPKAQKVAEAIKDVPIVFISFERADYSKGALERLQAFQLFMEQNPQYKGQVKIVLGMEATRTDIAAYTDYAVEVQSLAEQINQDKSLWVNGSPPVVACPKIPHVDLVPLLRQQEGQITICPINASADGANLVCKEFVMAQDLENAGRLILSNNTGSGREEGFAKHSILFTPNRNNPQELADAMLTAIEMPQETANKNCRHAQDYLRHNGLNEWTISFLDVVEKIQASLGYEYDGPENPMPEAAQ